MDISGRKRNHLPEEKIGVPTVLNKIWKYINDNYKVYLRRLVGNSSKKEAPSGTNNASTLDGTHYSNFVHISF